MNKHARLLGMVVGFAALSAMCAAPALSQQRLYGANAYLYSASEPSNIQWHVRGASEFAIGAPSSLTVSIGAPINIPVAVRNEGTTPRSINYFAPRISFKVTRVGGATLEQRSDVGTGWECSMCPGPLTLQPNASIVFVRDLSLYYKIVQPGDYLVTTSYRTQFQENSLSTFAAPISTVILLHVKG